MALQLLWVRGYFWFFEDSVEDCEGFAVGGVGRVCDEYGFAGCSGEGTGDRAADWASEGSADVGEFSQSVAEVGV